jgi:hypothetical protein
MQQVKGAVLKTRMAFVRDVAGEQGVQSVLGSLSPEDQQALKAILTVKWYPFDLGKRLDAAIVHVVGKGDRRFFERLGEASAAKNLSSVHESFLAPGKPHTFLGRAGVIYGLYYETGHRTYERVGDREALLTTHDAETFSSADCATVVGWYRKAMEMCGARGVVVDEEQCRARGHDVCRYRVRWEAP